MEFLEGLAWAADRGLRAEVSIVGDGPLRQEVETRADAIDSSVRVNITGAVTRDEMPAIYRRHDALIHLSKAEGVSNVLLEALASGLVIVGTDAVMGSFETERQYGLAINKPEGRNRECLACPCG